MFVLAVAACGDGAGARPPDARTGDGGPSCPQPRPGCDSWEACNAGDCVDTPLYECDPDTGEWVDTTIVCEAEIVDVTGTTALRVRAQSRSGECPGLPPRSPVLIDVASDTLQLRSPMTLIEGSASGGFGDGFIHVAYSDSWDGTPVEGELHLQVYGYGVGGGGTLAAEGCDVSLYATGQRCTLGVVPCAIQDDGWEVRCLGDQILALDRSVYSFCAVGSEAVDCALPAEGGTLIDACASGCADATSREFATTAEFLAFDPQSLCATSP